MLWTWFNVISCMVILFWAITEVLDGSRKHLFDVLLFMVLAITSFAVVASNFWGYHTPPKVEVLNNAAIALVGLRILIKFYKRKYQSWGKF